MGAVVYSEADDVLYFTEPTMNFRGESADLYAYDFITGTRRYLVNDVSSVSLVNAK